MPDDIPLSPVEESYRQSLPPSEAERVYGDRPGPSGVRPSQRRGEGGGSAPSEPVSATAERLKAEGRAPTREEYLQIIREKYGEEKVKEQIASARSKALEIRGAVYNPETKTYEAVLKPTERVKRGEVRYVTRPKRTQESKRPVSRGAQLRAAAKKAGMKSYEVRTASGQRVVRVQAPGGGTIEEPLEVTVPVSSSEYKGHATYYDDEARTVKWRMEAPAKTVGTVSDFVPYKEKTAGEVLREARRRYGPKPTPKQIKKVALEQPKGLVTAEGKPGKTMTLQIEERAEKMKPEDISVEPMWLYKAKKKYLEAEKRVSPYAKTA